MDIELITIGSELLLGFTIDTNAADLARALASVGARVVRKTVVADDAQAIRDAVGAALARVAQQTIDTWGRGRRIEIPESLMARTPVRPGYPGDIAYAETMAALPGLVAVVGPQSSRATLLTAPVYGEPCIPLIAPTATSRRLRAAGAWVFQLAPDDSTEGAFIVRFVLDGLHARRVTIFYLDASEYGNGLRDGLVEALAARGLTPLDEVGVIEQSPFARRVTTSLRRAAPEAVGVAGRSAEAAAIARAVHTVMPGVPVVVADAAVLNQAFITAVGPAASMVYGVTWWSPDLPDTASRAFAGRWRQARSAR